MGLVTISVLWNQLVGEEQGNQGVKNTCTFSFSLQVELEKRLSVGFVFAPF